jgi:hypothetical protein
LLPVLNRWSDELSLALGWEASEVEGFDDLPIIR